MIFTDRTIIVQKGTSSINDTIVLYRGDREVEIRFTLNESSPFKFGSGVTPNIIEKTEAAYGQLVIKTPGDKAPIFSEITATKKGAITFTITAEMIDEITEVGNYTFQIRLLDENKEGRVTIPEVVNGIEVREPIATEDISDTNEVGIAAVGYALTTAGTTEDTFDSQGNYNKTTWGTGDRITAAKLNKIEAGIEGVNQKVASGGTVDLSGYVTKETGNANQITFTDGQTFQAKLDAGMLKGDKGEKGDKGDPGEQGPQGIQGPKGDSGASNINDTTASATTTYSSNKIESIKENLSSQIKEIENIGNPTDEQVSNAINQAIADGKITSGNGWSTNAITLFETLISKLAFTDIVTGKSLATSLINELKSPTSSGGSSGGGSSETPSVKTYTITYSLGEATSSNNITSIEENTSYTTILSNPNNIYISSVTVLMNGENITDTVYTADTKTITIERVTGNLIITVITKSFDNLIIASTCTDGETMPNGAIITPGTYLITDYIEVKPSTDYYINITRYIDNTNTDWGQGVFYYGSDKTYIGYSQVATNSPMNTMTKYTTNDTTYFIRIKFHVNYRNTAYFGLSGVNE